VTLGGQPRVLRLGAALVGLLVGDPRAFGGGVVDRLLRRRRSGLARGGRRRRPADRADRLEARRIAVGGIQTYCLYPSTGLTISVNAVDFAAVTNSGTLNAQTGTIAYASNNTFNGGKPLLPVSGSRPPYRVSTAKFCPCIKIWAFIAFSLPSLFPMIKEDKSYDTNRFFSRIYVAFSYAISL